MNFFNTLLTHFDFASPSNGFASVAYVVIGYLMFQRLEVFVHVSIKSPRFPYWESSRYQTSPLLRWVNVVYLEGYNFPINMAYRILRFTPGV